MSCRGGRDGSLRWSVASRVDFLSCELSARMCARKRGSCTIGCLSDGASALGCGVWGVLEAGLCSPRSVVTRL